MSPITSILLIDDSASVREVLRVALEFEGYHILEAADGREGVSLYREHRPGLVIADVVMPEKDGIETVKDILAIDPTAVIFIMSGKAGKEENIEVARMLGARWGFQKPIRVDSLLGAIHEHLKPPTPKHKKVYKQGFKVTVHETGILIEAVDYHTQPLVLDAVALAELGLRPPTLKHKKVYQQGFKVTVYETGIRIEAVDYHTRPLFLDAEALAELGLKLDEDDSHTGDE